MGQFLYSFTRACLGVQNAQQNIKSFPTSKMSIKYIYELNIIQFILMIILIKKQLVSNM